MRVITGFARGLRLCSPAGSEIRPTSDRTKEAMFSILQDELPGASVLDLFAGSGQLGIEALSRGALRCTFVDADKRAQNLVRENLRRAKMEESARLAAMDGRAYLRGTQERFDVALLDPPYKKGILEEALPLAAAAMRPGGVIVCETAYSEEPPAEAGGFAKVRDYRYGKTRVTVYRRPAPDAREALEE